MENKKLKPLKTCVGYVMKYSVIGSVALMALALTGALYVFAVAFVAYMVVGGFVMPIAVSAVSLKNHDDYNTVFEKVKDYAVLSFVSFVVWGNISLVLLFMFYFIVGIV